MAKIISQETFDNVVKENMIEFSMDADEAKSETITQFETQGINLANIVKDLTINSTSGKPVLNETVEKLKSYVDENFALNKTDVLELLIVLEQECQKSVAYRILAAKLGALDVLISIITNEFSASKEMDTDIVKDCLKAANSILNQQPDIFGPDVLFFIFKLLKLEDKTILCLTLQLLQKACIMHENNRQNIINADIIDYLNPLLLKEDNNIARDLLAVYRCLVLDDDIRLEFSSAHEHARQIASNAMVTLTKLLTVYKDVNILADLLLTMGTLAVRQEICTVIADAGGLELIFMLIELYPSAMRLNREALKLLRALAGNDLLKLHIVRKGGPKAITSLLRNHMSTESVAIAALACIATLTLRVKENSQAFFDSGIAEDIVTCMGLHTKSKMVQRNGAWAIRNMVSRSREQCETWLSFGTEDLLNAAMTDHPSVEQDIKAALRDLGCKVELKEEWTGTAEKKITS